MTINCPECNKEIIVNVNRKRKQKFCSVECVNKYQKGKEKKKGEDRKIGSGGLRYIGGRTKHLKYISPIAGELTLNKDEIRLATILDYLKINWKRNSVGFKYYDIEGNEKKYYPDFYLPDTNHYLEYKGWVIEKMIVKMNSAIKENNLKLLIIYGTDKRYNKLGINIQEVENNPEIIKQNIHS